MKKIFIVATEIHQGRGGIQTAIQGYCDGLKTTTIDTEIIVSHKDSDVLYFFWFKAFFNITKAAIKNRGSDTVFWFHSGPWLSLIRKFTLSLIPLLLGCQVVNHIHSPVMANYVNNRWQKAWLHFLLLPYKKLVVLTPWWKKLFQDKGFTQEILVSANPIGSQLQQNALAKLQNQQRASELPLGKVNILSMARLMEGKGIELVIRALKHLPEQFQLTIAGSGPLEHHLQSICSELQLQQRVRFEGWVSAKKKEQLFQSHQLFCLPSRYDSFGMVFIEAMAYNLPILGLNWGPMSDIITADVGIICEHATEQCVADNIKYLADNLNIYHDAGPNKVLKDYLPNIAAQRIIKYFEK